MKKKILFSLLACFLFIALAEAFLYLFFPDPEPRLFIPSGRENRFYATNPYFLRREYKKASFVMPKPPDRARVFCLGGSTTAGYFPDLMAKMLILISPHQRFEVINCGRHSLGIANVTERLDELARFDPDVFILYSGHNEFMINNLSYTREETGHPLLFNFRKGLGKIRLYRAWRRQILRFKKKESGGVFYTLPLQIHQLDEYPRQAIFPASDYRMVSEHYRRHLEKIIAFCRKKGILLLVSNLVSNLRDFNPGVSVLTCDLDHHSERNWRSAYMEGTDLYRRGAFDGALKALSRAETLCDSFADLHFLKGKIYEASGSYEPALRSYERAKNLDAVPFRAVTRINRLITETCGRHHVPLLDTVRIFKDRSPHGLVGRNLIVDNVHPSPEGAFLIARGFCELLEDEISDRLPGGFQWPGTWDTPFELLGLNQSYIGNYYIYLARYMVQLAALTRNKEPRIRLAREYLERAREIGLHGMKINRAARYLDLMEKDPRRAIEKQEGNPEGLLRRDF